MTPAQEIITSELQKNNHAPRSAYDLTKSTGLGSRTVYEVLRRLEDGGQIKSSFLLGAFPRRRVYYLPKKDA